MSWTGSANRRPGPVNTNLGGEGARLVYASLGSGLIIKNIGQGQ